MPARWQPLGADLVVMSRPYDDLGTESIKKLEVEGFPAIVACDMYGGDLLLAGKEQYRDQATLGSYVSVPPAEKAG